MLHYTMKFLGQQIFKSDNQYLDSDDHYHDSFNRFPPEGKFREAHCEFFETILSLKIV